jgi:aspartate kinase
VIVMKFGGTSVESREAIQRVCAIVESRRDGKPIVVVSAMGKTTNRLLAIANDATAGRRDEALAALRQLEQYHLTEGGEVEGAVQRHFQELSELVRGLAVLGELTPRSVDAISAYGERLSSLILADALRQRGTPAVQVDARELIVTDERHTQANPLYPETYARLQARLPDLAKDRVVVMGGFIAATAKGVTSTLGRGGSDFSAAIAGAGIGAREIQIWTDVDGMLTCDPRILPVGHRIKVISFAEAAELAYFGAKVLHPSTVLPAVEKDIPVLILNSRRPGAEGTRIVADAVPSANPVKALACKRGITVVNIRSTRMLMAHGFLRRIFEVFDRHETPVDMVATSEVSVSLTIDNTRALDAIAGELREFSEVSVARDQALVAAVGERIGTTAGIAGRLFKALDRVNVRMISEGASLLNLSFVVANEDVERTVAALHEEFFRELDPSVFERRTEAVTA